MMPVTSSSATAVASFSVAALKFVTYVLWCFEWWSSMIVPEMTGSSAEYS